MHPFDDVRCGRSLFNRQRFRVRARGYEGQHHQVGVGIHEHILHELFGIEAVQVRAADTCALFAAGIGQAGQGPGVLRQLVGPGAGRVHEVALDVEDKLLAFDAGCRQLGVQCRFRVQLEVAAALAAGGIGAVEGEQGTGCAAGADQK